MLNFGFPASFVQCIFLVPELGARDHKEPWKAIYMYQNYVKHDFYRVQWQIFVSFSSFLVRLTAGPGPLTLLQVRY